MEIWKNGLAVSCMVFGQTTVILCKQINTKKKQSFMYMEVLNKC